MRRAVALALGLCVLLLWPRCSEAALCTFGFSNITGNSAANSTAGESQLFVDVIDAGAGKVLFNFRNEGPVYCRIDAVYFDGDSLLSLESLVDADEGSGGDIRVDFSQGVKPENLPGGESLSPDFEVTEGFLAGSDSPGKSLISRVYKPGVEPGQFLGMLFNLPTIAAGFEYDTLFSDVIEDIYSSSLRIGLHVKAFDGGGSESFVNNPEPATILLFGLGGLVFLKKPRIGR